MPADADKQLLAALERRNRELATLVETAKALTSTLSLPDLLKLILEKVSLLLESQSWSLLLVDPQTGELTFEIAVSPAARELKGMRLAKGQGIAGWVAEHGEPLLIRDVHRDPRFAAQVDKTRALATESVACVPVRIRDKVLGVVELVNGRTGERFDETDLAILTTVADFVAIAIDNARHVEQIRELTITDDLSGLYNDRHFHALLEYEIERASRYQTSLSLAFIDLDHFKRVNDTWGHLVGSRVLRETGQLIRDSIRRVNLAARYGGDEFVIILPATGKAGALAMAEKLRKRIREYPYTTDDGQPIRLTASFGVATFPDDATTKQQLISRADLAMYRVKESSRDGVLGA
jgi:diguanylate cyclase (GGDEF)-like protein